MSAFQIGFQSLPAPYYVQESSDSRRASKRIDLVFNKVFPIFLRQAPAPAICAVAP